MVHWEKEKRDSLKPRKQQEISKEVADKQGEDQLEIRKTEMIHEKGEPNSQ